MEKRAFKVLASLYGGDFFLRRIGSRSYLEVNHLIGESKNSQDITNYASHGETRQNVPSSLLTALCVLLGAYFFSTITGPSSSLCNSALG